MKPFPFSHHRGCRDTARRLLWEAGVDASEADWMDPETIEVLAATGRLARTAEDGPLAIATLLTEADREWRMSVSGMTPREVWRSA